jgi:hypothetical protein
VPQPGDVSRTSAEALAREARRLLKQGGEHAPVLRRDPRVPAQGRVEAEEPAPAAA